MADGSGEETIEREDYEHLLDEDLRRDDETADDATVDDLERELGDATATETTDATTPADDTTENEDGRSWLPSRPSAGGLLDKLFSPKQFLGRAVVLAALSVLAGFVPFVNGVFATGIGVLLGAFLLGLASSQRRYTETTVAGATVGVGLLFLSNVGLAVVSGDPTRIAAIGGGLGAILALIGVYFGRDLRAGLTKEI